MADILQRRLCSLVDLSLTLKHIHWNVVGPSFIGVHRMLDPQHEGVGCVADGVRQREERVPTGSSLAGRGEFDVDRGRLVDVLLVGVLRSGGGRYGQHRRRGEGCDGECERATASSRDGVVHVGLLGGWPVDRLRSAGGAVSEVV